ncbi:type II secretion system F family protein [Bordetella genomosp. 13]|uniref:type II secretion system F family protein n=1 Tax=Bordetella genomosp. 13 TaxID=463040 RepID=UPI00119D5152|nr:type II secretion system F family protein [Bordetella genomosp. 13]
MGAALVLVLLAVLLLGGAALLLRRAGADARHSAQSAFLTKRLETQAAVQGAVSVGFEGRYVPQSGGSWARLLLQAGIRPTPRFYFMLILPVVVVTALAWLLGGWFSAAAALGLTMLLSYFRIWYKADRRKRRMVAQLPSFLDAVVRLITIGNSVSAAFQGGLANIDQPLLEVLQRADALARSGKDLDASLLQVSRQYGLRELFLVSSVISLALRFGGRSDQVLERMAAFMRDLEHAREELVALSAEVRLSAWILALLPIGLALFIIMFNNALFTGMWNDPMGFKLLMIAVALQIGGSYWLYRMARGV